MGHIEFLFYKKKINVGDYLTAFVLKLKFYVLVGSLCEYLREDSGVLDPLQFHLDQKFSVAHIYYSHAQFPPILIGQFSVPGGLAYLMGGRGICALEDNFLIAPTSRRT